MAVLSDKNILTALDSGILKIDPFNQDNLTPNGYDLTISEIALPNTSAITTGSLSIQPNTRFAVSTLENIVCASNITAQLWLRTSWARKGVMATFGKVDAGFDGTLTIASFNADTEEIIISIGETYAQIVFETLSEKAEKVYGERSGNYQNQSGITWSKDK
ncbi:MAG: dCTP deaminase [Marine Group III euryarchaeote CG-Bathy1]|uniref:dCTP deaminase n=1 Tax=Marine Group III euryarchaeote CG-Bathy1 TaxID=1889001 RepID=A0A1J5T2Y0_9ARCH|nr:MAG: dCTP deaminase [Marine Group III euryarchaeote CG-Bathy1]